MSEFLSTAFHTEETFFKYVLSNPHQSSLLFLSHLWHFDSYPWSLSKLILLNCSKVKRKVLKFFSFNKCKSAMSLWELSSIIALVGLALKIKAFNCFIFKQKSKCSLFWINLWVTYLNYRLLCIFVGIREYLILIFYDY